MRIGFFGAGNMVSAIALGIFQNNKDVKMYFYTPSKVKAQNLALKTNGIYVNELEEMPKDLDWYFLGFKPQSLKDFDFHFANNQRVVSLLASTTVESLINKFDSKLKFVRVMPNTPSSVFAGMNLIYYTNEILEAEKIELNNLFAQIGKISVLETESAIDLLTPFSGSGPGIIFELASYLENTLKKLNVSNIDTREIIAQTFFGSSKLMMESTLDFTELRDQVTSKKGVTEAAINSMKHSDVESLLEKSIKSAHNRIEEMKKGI